MYPSMSRSRRKEKSGRHDEFASDRIPAKPAARRNEAVQFARVRNESDITYGSVHHDVCSLEENSLSLGFRRHSSKRASGTPIKALIDEEVSKEMQAKRTSPGLVARLMGLDTLPAQVVNKNAKLVSQNMSPNESQECKDVFEVMEASKLKKHRNQSTKKGLLSSKRAQTDIDLIRQKFMDAKRLSTDEALQSSKELKDALEILDSNKDLLLEFLQDPNSLFKKHLEDLNHGSPSPLPGQITILKSSKGAKFGGSEVWSRPEDNHGIGKSSHTQKHTPNHADRSLKEQGVSHRQKSSVSRSMNNTETRSHATRIVVLKPSLEKAQKMAGAVSFGYENFHFSSKNQNEFMISGTKELLKEGRERQKFSTNLEYTDRKAKGSREIAREITRQMRQNVTTRSKRTNFSELNSYLQSESSLSDFAKLNNSESFCKLPDPFDEWSNGLSPSSSCSTESSMNREARKRLSERWKMTYRLQEMGLIDRGSSTLGEILALSDIEMPSATVDSTGKRKTSDVKISKNESHGSCGYPLGISSKDGWKDGNSRNLQRSKSLPTLSSVSQSTRSSKIKHRGGSNSYCMLPSKNSYCMLKDVLHLGPEDFPDEICNMQGRSVQNPPNHTNKFNVFHPTREETMVPEREIHVHSEEPRKTAHVGHFSEAKPLRSVPVDEAVVDRKHVNESDSIPLWEHETHSSNSPIDQVKQSFLFPMENEELPGKNQNDVVIQETSIDCPQVDPILYQPEADESCPSLCSKECEQPSPVSVLEPPSEEGSSASGCFERISADLQELRMQLKLLKLESGGNADDSDITASSDEDCAVNSHLSLPAGQIIQAFRSEDDRDFSYVLDMLIDSGIHGANQERLPDCCQSPSYSMDQHVFTKLEKKYSTVTSWSRSERKLLFDSTNCILSSMVQPSMDQHPWVMSKRYVHARGRDDLVEGLWQMVVKQRENIGNGPENVLDPRWLNLEEEVQFISKEIEEMLNDDLLEELIADFSGSVCSDKGISLKFECSNAREVLIY